MNYITLKTNKDAITFTKATTGVKNIVFGNMYIDNYGVMK